MCWLLLLLLLLPPPIALLSIALAQGGQRATAKHGCSPSPHASLTTLVLSFEMITIMVLQHFPQYLHNLVRKSPQRAS
jgi:hypothetical protein